MKMFWFCWLVLCVVAIWLWFYSTTKKDNGGVVDGFDIILITITSVLLGLMGNVAILIAYAFARMVFSTPIEKLLPAFAILFIAFFLLKKCEDVSIWAEERIKRFRAEREERKADDSYWSAFLAEEKRRYKRNKDFPVS